MHQIGLWQIVEGAPRKLPRTTIDLESKLEDWIERDPGLLEAGLTIVGRQVPLAGGTLDLLALDPQGRWVVIELKRGTLYRDTITQALDYAACVAAMPHADLAALVEKHLADRPAPPAGLSATQVRDEAAEAGREVRIIVAGAGKDAGLERLIDFLAGKYGLPITAVSFAVYTQADGSLLLVRQLTEAEGTAPEAAARRWVSLDEMYARADAGGIGAGVRAVVEAAARNGLVPRPWKRIIQIAPPQNRVRALMAVRAVPAKPGELWVWFGPEAFAQFYPVTEEDVVRELGPGGWRRLAGDDVAAVVTGLDRLLGPASSAAARDETP